MVLSPDQLKYHLYTLINMYYLHSRLQDLVFSLTQIEMLIVVIRRAPRWHKTEQTSWKVVLLDSR